MKKITANAVIFFVLCYYFLDVRHFDHCCFLIVVQRRLDTMVCQTLLGILRLVCMVCKVELDNIHNLEPSHQHQPPLSTLPLRKQ